jgi:hypothetical protein
MAKERESEKVVFAVKEEARRHARQYEGVLCPMGSKLGMQRVAEAFMLGAICENKRLRLAKLKKDARRNVEDT